MRRWYGRGGLALDQYCENAVALFQYHMHEQIIPKINWAHYYRENYCVSEAVHEVLLELGLEEKESLEDYESFHISF